MGSPESLRSRVERALHGRRELSTLAAVLRRVDRIASKHESSAQELADAVGTDSVLTAKVLRLANSAHFSLDRHISSVNDAVIILGYSRVRTLCSGMLTSGVMGEASHSSGFDAAAMWRHSLGTAVATESILEQLGGGDKDDLFVAGLLCNIGRTILDQFFTEDFERALTLAKDTRIALQRAEIEVFGAGHAEVGFWAAELWGLDESLAHAIKNHHGPSGSRSSDVINLAYVATQALRIGSPGDSILAQLLPGLLGRMELDAADLDGLLRDMEGAYESLEPLFMGLERG